MADNGASSKKIGRRWWEKFYDDSPYIVYLENQTKNELEEAADFLTNKLELAPGAIVYDQCCGMGSLGLKLASNGIILYGSDIASSMITKARAAAQKAGLDSNTTFTHADAFEYICPEPADAVFNWHTSFGYGDDEENARMIERAYQSLKPGGRFALDYPNIAVVLGKFKKTMTRSVTTADGVLTINRESLVDARQGRLEQTWTFSREGGESESFHGSVRLYLPSDLCRMLEEAGFGSIELFGNTNGDWLNLETNRCIVVAKKEI